jgi:hypothetical protein
LESWCRKGLEFERVSESRGYKNLEQQLGCLELAASRGRRKQEIDE